MSEQPTTPEGQQYRVPTAAELQQRAEVGATNLLRLQGAETRDSDWLNPALAEQHSEEEAKRKAYYEKIETPETDAARVEAIGTVTRGIVLARREELDAKFGLQEDYTQAA